MGRIMGRDGEPGPPKEEYSRRDKTKRGRGVTQPKGESGLKRGRAFYYHHADHHILRRGNHEKSANLQEKEGGDS